METGAWCSPAPQVEVALADCGRVDWKQYPELDPDEPDSRVVAQALSARGPSRESRMVVSQDIRPLHLARQHGLRAYHIGENWLRPKEISESDKRAASLQREIDAMKNRQPKLKLSFRANKEVVSVHRVHPLSSLERKEIQDTIVQLQPMPEQKQDLNVICDPFGGHDYSLTERYRRWEKQIIPQFVREYEHKLELNFGQVEIFFRVENIGQVPAESLLIRLSAQGGWLNERYVLAIAAGPGAPKVRQSSHLRLPNMHLQSVRPNVQPGKHELVVQERPKRSTEIQITCADFRHGHNYEYRLIGWVDPRADDFRVEAVVTAANLYGEAREILAVGKMVIESSVYDLVDLENLKFRQPPEIVDFLTAAVRKNDLSDFEFDGAGWDK